MKLNLKGFQGNVKKTATVLSNDPRKSRTVLTLHGYVKALVELRPSNTVTFRGLASQLPEHTISLVGTIQPFHIEKTETNLEGKISYQLVTVEEGKKYDLKVSNRMKQGNYGGFIKLSTDLAQKPLVVVRIIGYVEGEIAIKPQTVLVGKLVDQQSLRLGKVLVVNNHDKPFKITDLKFDAQLIDVTQQPLPGNNGYSLEITPKLESVSAGGRRQTAVTFQTDVTEGEQFEVNVHVLNSGAEKAARPTDDEADDSGDGDEDEEE